MEIKEHTFLSSRLITLSEWINKSPSMQLLEKSCEGHGSQSAPSLRCFCSYIFVGLLMTKHHFPSGPLSTCNRAGRQRRANKALRAEQFHLCSCRLLGLLFFYLVSCSQPLQPCSVARFHPFGSHSSRSLTRFGH